MKYSYRWLKELTGTKKSPEALAKLLVTHAFEVEGIEKRESGLENVIVGEVIGLDSHPNADKLRIAEVRLGKSEVTRIVCGAPNIEIGQKVAVAVPGALLPGGRRIEEATIRGVASHGMICSSKELGLDENHEGILVLPDDVSPGTLFAKHFLLDDTIIEVKILPDRASDALSYYGLAREIAALDGYAPAFVKENLRAVTIPAYNRAPRISVLDKKSCRRYIGMTIKNVTVTASPLWLQVKLILSGIRPINNVVDATNYLMLLTGGPIHAFDADAISGAVAVRKAKKNERLELLSGETIKLTASDLVIADDRQALALAGIMGGKKSAIRKETKNVFLEIASFDPSTIRRSKTYHKLSSEAGYRFERNVDPNLPKNVARMAARLLPSLTGGRVLGFREVASAEFRPWTINLSLARVESVLGIALPLFAVVKYLALLDLKVKKVADKAELRVVVDTRRPDLRDEWDLVEEIGRMHGYDKITPVPPSVPLTSPLQDRAKTFERRIKEAAVARGFDEIMTYSFYGRRDVSLSGLNADGHLELENPMNPEQEFLRVSLLPNILKKIRENQRHFRALSFFEYGSVFQAAKKGLAEEKMAGFAVSTEEKDKGAAFFVLKNKLETFFEMLGLPRPTFTRLERENVPGPYGGTFWHQTRTAEIFLNGKKVGILGDIHPTVLKNAGVRPGIALAEVRVADLLSFREKTVFQPLQKYPYAVRDISLLFPKDISVGEVEEFLRNSSALLKKFELFDVYEKENEKSLAFHLYFGGNERTLTSAEMDGAFDEIVALAREKFGARLPVETY